MRLARLGAGNTGPRYYLNSISVGLGGSNVVGPDVMLVQFFLYIFFEQHSGATNDLQPPGSTFVIDGKAGPQTAAGIRVFQDYWRRRGRPTLEGITGRVNAVVPPPVPAPPPPKVLVPTRRPSPFGGDLGGGVGIGVGSGLEVAKVDPPGKDIPRYTIVGLNDYFFREPGNNLRYGKYLYQLHTFPLIANYHGSLARELARVER